MTNDELDVNELELLMKALDALDAKGKMGDAMSSLLGMMLSRSPEQADRFIQENERIAAEKANERALLTERIILVKAKLIRLKDRALVGELEN